MLFYFLSIEIANNFVPSPSQASIASMNTDGSMGMYGGQSMTSPLSSNMSPMSQTSDSSGASYFQNLNITSTNGKDAMKIFACTRFCD